MSYHPNRKKSQRNTHSKEEIEAAAHNLNETIDRIGQNILPRQPYLVTVPSDVPYRHSRGFVNTWYVGTPFDKDEEQLQYVSFLPHQDVEEEALLQVVGGWSDDQGNLLEEEPSPRTNFDSGRNTPLDPSNRKKITLKDYKKDKRQDEQDQDSTPRPELQQDTSPDPGQNNADSLKVLAQSKNNIVSPRIEVTRVGQDKPTAKKGKDQTISQLDGNSSPLQSNKMGEDSPRRTKRRRLSLSPESDELPRTAEEETSKPMPKLLSPTLPSAKREAGLPELLSPLLPPTLTKALATPPPSGGNDVAQSHQRSDSVRSVLATALSEGTSRTNDKNGPNSGSLGGSRVRSDSQHSVRSNTSVSSSKNVTQLKAGGTTSLRPSTPTSTPSRSPGPRQRHIIALKYGKKNRKRVEALLKFASRPKKATKPKEASITSTRPQPALKDSPKLEKSHDRAMDGQTPKATRADSPVEHVKRPTTPVPAAGKVSTGQATSSLKSVYTTPQKDLKSTAMRRVESTEDGDAATPSGKARSSTPLGTDRSIVSLKTSPGLSSTPSLAEQERKEWSQIGEKYHAIGRSIKHEVDGKHPDGSPLQAALMVEALLCFMAQMSVHSYRKPVDPGWASILAYHIATFRRARKFPHLLGLVTQLGAVCRQTLHKYYMERLAKEPLPDEHSGSAPTPGSDGNTKISEDGERNRKKYLKFRDLLVENERELQQAWLDGSKRLSPELLRSDYPKTWARRSRDYDRRGRDKPTPTTMSNGYFLPLDVSTTALEAVQFGLTMLDEWTAAEGVDWKSRLEL